MVPFFELRETPYKSGKPHLVRKGSHDADSPERNV